MWLLYSLLLLSPPLLLLAAGLVPTAWANRHIQLMRQVTLGLSMLAFLFAVLGVALLVTQGPLDYALLLVSYPLPLNIGVYFDSLAAVMLLLISFIGTIIARYSVRYLDGEATQGRFSRWMMFTLGSVLLLVVSRNLVMFTAAWMLTSFGLHQLLTHYPDRPWAIWAARKKFLISRLGDLMLIAALALTYVCFKSFDYGEVFARAAEFAQASQGAGWLISLIGTLYVLGAMTKSAQFPFHSWLPDTMETPTPVSALMHAGIINAGGFLVIRLSPLISLSHIALDFLAIVGAFTALLGGVIMLTQTSVKRSLAYSTIAQMGFMMLQCGLGAYSAALLHIVAHSVYKAHAFLSSGSVLAVGARLNSNYRPTSPVKVSPATLPVAFALASSLCFGTCWLLGIDYFAKPGAAVLGLILSLALTHLLWQSLHAHSWRLATQGVLACIVVSVAYFTAYVGMDWVMSFSVSHTMVQASLLNAVVIGIVACGFLGVFVLQALAGSIANSSFMQMLYVHALNGFYVDIPARRLTARFWGHTAPVP